MIDYLMILDCILDSYQYLTFNLLYRSMNLLTTVIIERKKINSKEILAHYLTNTASLFDIKKKFINFYKKGKTHYRFNLFKHNLQININI